jgi:hypothetical protein
MGRITRRTWAQVINISVSPPGRAALVQFEVLVAALPVVHSSPALLCSRVYFYSFPPLKDGGRSSLSFCARFSADRRPARVAASLLCKTLPPCSVPNCTSTPSRRRKTEVGGFVVLCTVFRLTLVQHASPISLLYTIDPPCSVPNCNPTFSSCYTLRAVSRGITRQIPCLRAATSRRLSLVFEHPRHVQKFQNASPSRSLRTDV